MAVAMVLLACQDGLTKKLVAGLPPSQLVMVRFWAFAAFATLFATIKGNLLTAIRSRYPVLNALRGLLLALEIGVFAFVIHHLPLSATQMIFALCPLILLALSPVALHEHVEPRQWIAVGVGFLGVLLIIRPSGGLFNIYALIAIGGAILFAVYNILTRLTARSDHFSSSFLYVAWFGAIGSSMLGPFQWQMPNAEESFFLILLCATSIAAHMTIIKALSMAPASTLQPITYVQIAVGIIVGMAAFGEFPDFWMYFGGLLIIGAGLSKTGFRQVRRSELRNTS